MAPAQKRSTPPTESVEPPKKKLHSMFTPASARPAALFKWHASLGVSASCLHGTWKSPAGSSKIAAFDIDGTIIKTKTGNTFPSSKDDWKLWSANVKAKLKEAHDQGFAIVLLSNQGYKGKRASWFKEKLPDIAAELEVPFHVFAAKDKDEFRKPETGMWDIYLKSFNDGIAVDMKESFFVGDAAGRRADHSDSDLEMAKNAKLPFKTPEEYFTVPPKA